MSSGHRKYADGDFSCTSDVMLYLRSAVWNWGYYHLIATVRPSLTLAPVRARGPPRACGGNAS